MCRTFKRNQLWPTLNLGIRSKLPTAIAGCAAAPCSVFVSFGVCFGIGLISGNAIGLTGQADIGASWVCFGQRLLNP